MQAPRAIIGKEIVQEVHQAVNLAGASIDIMFYSASTPSARTPLALARLHQAYTAAPARGISCRALFAAWKTGTPQDIESRRFADTLHATGWHVRFATVQPILHPKTWIFDRASLIIGSHNSTTAGMTMNKNISIFTTEPEAARRVLEFFDMEWQKAAANG